MSTRTVADAPAESELTFGGGLRMLTGGGARALAAAEKLAVRFVAAPVPGASR